MTDRDRRFGLGIVVALVAGAVALVAMGEREHAGMLIAGALGYAGAMRPAPGQVARLVPLGAGLGASTLLGGCAGIEVSAGAGSPWIVGWIGALAVAFVALAWIARRAVRHVAPLALVLVVGSTLGGCAGTQAGHVAGVVHTVARVTCAGAQRLADACARLGLAPEEPCPLGIGISSGDAPELPAPGRPPTGGE